jgi:hypothetical protein
MFDKVIKVVTTFVGKKGLVIQQHSPEILLTVGIVGTVVSAVLACKATLKVEAVLDAHKEKTEKIHDTWEEVKEGNIGLEEYSEMDHKKDLAVTYIQTGFEFVKLYGLPVLIEAASIACVIGGHGIMKRRNVALIAAYKAIDAGFKAYRKRVVEEHGEKVDYMYKNGLREVEVTEAAYTDENGVKHKAVKKTMLTGDSNGLSVYAKFFDESSTEWSKSAEYNLFLLKSNQNYFNDMLKVKGHVFLNEVYDSLGIPRTQAGAQCGWVYGRGDSYIDFGVFDGDNVKARDFVNGYEKSILLDFNVDGPIYDVFTKEKV